MRIDFKLNKRTMTISEQLRFYDDNFFSHVRIGMLIRRNPEKTVSFVNAALGTEQLVVKIKPSEIVVHIPSTSYFEYDNVGPLTTLAEIAEMEKYNDPNEVFSPEEFLELGLFVLL